MPAATHGAIAPCRHGASGPCPGANASMGRVRRQATRADWTAEIEGKKKEERKFDKEERYEFPRFDLQNILEGRLYLF